MNAASALTAPLSFRPAYQVIVWGGRRMARYRSDLPEGPVGESWDLADHERGMSVVATGPLAGRTLRSLTEEHGEALVGAGFKGALFPLMVKLIDARDRLSVQVHPDDALAQQMGLGQNGKTECWYMVERGGSLYQGTRAGVDRAAFERALAEGRVAETLNEFSCEGGDFFFLDARTVHALGAGCLLYEVQQTSDVTFRVYDWGRMGLDGKPRPMHVAESLRTIDFARSGFGPRRPPAEPDPRGGEVRRLASCPYFTVEARVLGSGTGGGGGRASIVIATAGRGRIETAGGSCGLAPMQTVLVPAAAGPFRVEANEGALELLVAEPRF